MQQNIYESDNIRVVISNSGKQHQLCYKILAIEIRVSDSWQVMLMGDPSGEFITTAGSAFADKLTAVQNPATKDWIIQLSASFESWKAEETITISSRQSLVRRTQSYQFLESVECAIRPGFLLPASPSLKYTYPLQANEQSLAELSGNSFRADVAWALPFPFHFWHDQKTLCMYGVDRNSSPGTLESIFHPTDNSARLGIYYPDTTQQPSDISQLLSGSPARPQTARFEAGQTLTLSEIIIAKPISDEQEAWFEAVRTASQNLLEPSREPIQQRQVAYNIVEYFKQCELWEPDALGKDSGWFLNMWTYTQSGTPQRSGPGGGYFDLGWGEGVAVETILGLTRYWQRTGRRDILTYVNAISRGIQHFQRSPGAAEPYFDRSDGKNFSDFMGKRRIWLHSLGHIGSQLLQAFQENPDYPNADVRQAWFDAAANTARYCARIQRPDGSLPDIVDDQDQDIYPPEKHHITARAVACGLWARMAQISGDESWTERAIQLARTIAPEIERFEFENQMIDAIDMPENIPDGEGACYVLEGLVPLYAATGDAAVLRLCQKAAAFAAVWTYFFDLPAAYHGIARGGQCCRMPDVPLLFPVGPAKAIPPLLDLWQLTGDRLYRHLADEMAAYICANQIDAPGKPWHGGMLHAIMQFNGRHWGPDGAGQVDTGISTGNSLAALEYWLKNH